MPVLNEPIATEIIPGLWLGNYCASQNRKFIDDYKIKHIINVTPDYPNVFKDIEYVKIPVKSSIKSTHKILKNLLPYTYYFINKVLPGNILVHCKSGHRRSATVVAYYLMRKNKLSCKKAIELIKKRRPTTFPPKTYIKDVLN